MMPPSPKRRVLWKWLFAAFALVIAVTGGGIIFELHRASNAWAEACAEADRLDPGWRWNDLLAARPVAPEGQSVGERVVAAAQSISQGWPDWPTLLRDEDLPPVPPEPPMAPTAADGPVLPPPEGVPATPPSSDDRRKEFGEAASGNLADLPPTERLLPGHAAALRIALASVADAQKQLERLEQLSPGRLKREHADTALADVYPTQIQNTRNVIQVLRMRARIAADKGKGDAALADVRRMLAVARFAGAEPSMISKLVQMAHRSVTMGVLPSILAQTEPSMPALESTQAAIRAELSDPLILDAIRGERAYVEDTVRGLDDGRLHYDQMHMFETIAKVTGVATIDGWLQRLRGNGEWTKPRSAEVLRYQTYLIEIAKSSPDELRVHADAIAALRNAMSEGAERDVSTYDKYITAERRSRALLVTADAALAAERFRKVNDRWPTTLAELFTAKFVAAIPVDPFDGQPLRMRRLSDGLVIYSIGQDLTDNGGDVQVNQLLPGLSHDVGVRLWDVASRRQTGR